MKTGHLIVTAVLLSAGAWASAAYARQEPTTWSGVYTEAQAGRGEAAYATACASCHNADLSGDGFAPSLAGAEFQGNWNGTSVGDLFERVRISMPPSNPGAVSAQQKADILAFVLRANRFPAGQTELSNSAAALKGIKFEATKP